MQLIHHSHKSMQTTGYYILAGFSLGEIYTYEVAQKLLKNNEQVDGLLMNDMAVPNTIDSGLSPT